MNGTGDIVCDKKHIDNSKIDSSGLQTEKIDQSLYWRNSVSNSHHLRGYIRSP